MEFHATIDFNDDLWYAKGEWTEERLREFVRGLGARGIRALHWIDYGTAGDGMYDKGGYLDRMGTAAPFLKRVPEPLRVVADECHKNGMQTYTTLKVFDLCGGMPWSVRPAGDPGNPPVGVPFVGGEGVLAHRFMREHPECRAELHPSLKERSPRKPLRTIRLWHEGAELSKREYQIFVSQNNRDYRLYAGPQTVTISQRRRRPPVFAPAPEVAFGAEGAFACVEFSGLDVSAPFVVVAADGSELANTLAALVELEDGSGEAPAFTWGLGPVFSPEDRKPDWRKAGVAFDAAYGTDIPGRGWTYVESAGRHRFELSKRGFIGIARGRNDHLSGVTELACPEARQWLVQMAQRAADFGCDGVDVRVTTHTESLDWENYGFGKPVIDEFKRRHGVDIAAGEKFDRALWRRLRGDYFTQFLREIGGMLHARGKRLCVQVSDEHHRSPAEICYMEIFFDWQRWIREEMVDLVNITKFYSRPETLRPTTQLCHEHKIPMMHTVAMWSAKDEDWLRDGPIIMERCRREGIGIFNIYETSAIVRLEENGFNWLVPALWKMVEQHSTAPSKK